MTRLRLTAIIFVVFLATGRASADPPVASYIFPAGGQCGKTVNVRVGGLNLHKSCFFEMLGPGVDASKQLQRTRTLWFEGPRLALPESEFGLDVIALVGRLRHAEHRSVPEIHAELTRRGVPICTRSVGNLLDR